MRHKPVLLPPHRRGLTLSLVLTVPRPFVICVKYLSQATRKRSTLAIDSSDGNWPGGATMADAGRLKQILYNLLSNAIKFTSAGGSVTVGSALQGAPDAERDRAAAAASLRISVSDTGIGIRPEDQERVFREFEQIDSDHARAQRVSENRELGFTLGAVDFLVKPVEPRAAAGSRPCRAC
jgi:signal transduction histidine kinase